MQRPRLIDVRSSGFPAAVGLCATDISSIAAIVNEAQERLLNDPLAPDEGFWGGWVRMAFTVSQSEPTIVTPQGIARIILMDVCKKPVRINNEFYEFLEFGRGFQPTGCTVTSTGAAANPTCQTFMAYERETVTTFTPLLSTPQYIRAYAADPADVGRTCLIQGKDSNGQYVRYADSIAAQSGVGEKLTFGSPFADTQNLYSEITGVQKVKTFGEIQFYQVDPDTGAETSLLVMQPGETTASYRKYVVNGLPTHCCNTSGGVIQVLALCKLDFTPVQVDSDYLIIQSVPALIEEGQAIRFSRMDTPGAMALSERKHENALRLLFGQLGHMLGNERPAIGRHIFGSQPLRLNPI